MKKTKTYIESVLRIFTHPHNRDSKLRTALRLAWWKVNQIFFKYPVLVNMTDEASCLCYPNSSYGSLVFYTKLPDYRQQKYLLDSLTSNSVFLDIGANIGVYSILASTVIKEGKIYSFEVLENTLKCFRQNIAINGYQNIKIVEKIVSDNNGFEYFVEEDVPEVSHIANKTDEVHGKRLPSVRLDTFLSKEGVEYVDLIKVDVEGAEMKVLRGLEGFLKKDAVGKIILEINKNIKNYESKSEKVISFLQNYGFFPHLLDKNRKPQLLSNLELVEDKTEDFLFKKSG